MSNPVRNLASWVARGDRTTLFMCGAAGTGKTSVVNILQERLWEQAHVFRSTNREAIKELGFSSEGDLAKLTPKQKWDVQYMLFRTYMSKLNTFAAELNVKNRSPRSGKKVLILERSPVDYFAYWAANISQEYLTRHEASEIIEPMLKTVLTGNTRFVYYPWPTPWYESGKTKDGFRNVVRATDEAINTESVIALADIRRRTECDHNRIIDLGALVEATPEMRAEYILKESGL